MMSNTIWFPGLLLSMGAIITLYAHYVRATVTAPQKPRRALSTLSLQHKGAR